MMLFVAVLLAVPGARAAEPPARSATWIPVRHWTSVAVFALGFGVSAGLRFGGVQPRQSVIGPAFDPEAHRLLDASEAYHVSKRYIPSQRVTELELGALVISAGLIGGLSVVGGMSGGGWRGKRRRQQAAVDASMSFLETMGATLLMSEAMKYGFGRLRPDYLDRYEQLGCAESPDKTGCIQGRLSFVSGHASLAFAGTTWASLMLGGQLVWGPAVRGKADALEISIGATAQLALLAIATYVAVTRVQDNRHYTTDVVGGAILGFGMANLSYWSYFGADGYPRMRGAVRPSVTLVGRDGFVLSASGEF